MAPGGRRMSERPIPRPARRRLAGVGNDVMTPPTLVGRDQWVPYTVTSFEVHDGGVTSPAFGTFDKVLMWVFCKTTTFTPPTGWTTLTSGTHSGVQYWVGWVDGADAGTDWTLAFAAAAGYPEGYRTLHVVVDYFTGGTMTPQITSIDLASSVTSVPSPDLLSGWSEGRQVQYILGRFKTYARWADSGGTYDYTAISSTTDPAYSSVDYFQSGTGLLADDGLHSFYSDSGRTTPQSVDAVISFTLGWS